MGGSGRVNQQMRQDQLAAQQERNRLMAQANQPSAAETRFNQQSAAWDAWIKGKDYGKPPAGSLLNFDLYTPAMQAQQREKYANLTGIGAAGLGRGGDNSLALGMARERNINEMAQNNAANYENAVKQQDAYFNGQGLAWSGLQNSRNLGLLNNASGLEQFYANQYVQTRPQSWLPMLLGGALSAGGALLGNPGLFGGR